MFYENYRHAHLNTGRSNYNIFAHLCVFSATSAVQKFNRKEIVESSGKSHARMQRSRTGLQRLRLTTFAKK